MKYGKSLNHENATRDQFFHPNFVINVNKNYRGIYQENHIAVITGGDGVQGQCDDITVLMEEQIYQE